MDTSEKKISSADIFLNLAAMLTLYTCAVSFIVLWWQYVNFLVPDKLQNGTVGFYAYDPIRLASSILVVIFPVFLILSWLSGRRFKDEPERREARSRRWLANFTLFISAATILIDLIVLVFNFFKGDLTLHFILKLLVILIVAAAIFMYFLLESRYKKASGQRAKIFGWSIAAIVLASIVYGFFLIGTPAEQRDFRLDQRKMDDLNLIQAQIDNFVYNYSKLPENLEQLGVPLPSDPETGGSYEYFTGGEKNFSLCATFITSSTDLGGGKLERTDGRWSWEHPAGYFCFEREAVIKGLSVPIPTLPSR